MATRVSIQQRSHQARVMGKAALAVARTTGLRVGDARRLLEQRTVIPLAMEALAGAALALQLSGLGLQAIAVAGPPPANTHCHGHPALESEDSCESCRASICAVCVITHRERRCVECEAKRVRGRRFRNLRVGVLLALLLGISGWGVLRHRRLDARTRWIRTLSASVVLVSEQPVKARTRAQWTQGMDRVQVWFSREWNRYRPESPVPMVTLTLEGAVLVDRLPVAPGEAVSLADRAAETLSFTSALTVIDGTLPAHPARDATIYVLLKPHGEEGAIVEGVAEAGGRLGLVQGGLDDENLELELTAVAHELLHCLGATDKYDAQGHAVLPIGLADPGATPLYPQAAAEVMVGEVATGPASGREIKNLDEVQVGPVTASEIRW